MRCRARRSRRTAHGDPARRPVTSRRARLRARGSPSESSSVDGRSSPSLRTTGGCPTFRWTSLAPVADGAHEDGVEIHRHAKPSAARRAGLETPRVSYVQRVALRSAIVSADLVGQHRLSDRVGVHRHPHRYGRKAPGAARRSGRPEVPGPVRRSRIGRGVRRPAGVRRDDVVDDERRTRAAVAVGEHRAEETEELPAVGRAGDRDRAPLHARRRRRHGRAHVRRLGQREREPAERVLLRRRRGARAVDVDAHAVEREPGVLLRPATRLTVPLSALRPAAKDVVMPMRTTPMIAMTTMSSNIVYPASSRSEARRHADDDGRVISALESAARPGG